MNNKLIVVDLNSGSYTENLYGHELFNLERNIFDNKYYGYVPPYGNVAINNIEVGAIDFVKDVLVIYVQAISDDNKNREIIAYCKDATVYRIPRISDYLNRRFKDNDDEWKIAPYHIESDNLTDLRLVTPKFIIEINKYNPYMFRKQRSYLSKYPELKNEIIKYINRIKSMDNDNGLYQDNIQREKPASIESSNRYGNTQDRIVFTSSGKAIYKNASIAKKVLEDSDYKCIFNESHETFLTTNGKPYMEGHHLIPCTLSNSERFNLISKLDREENIVCICPTCHRAIHFGNEKVKEHMVEVLYKKQKNKLKSVRLVIDLDTLLSMY